MYGLTTINKGIPIATMQIGKDMKIVSIIEQPIKDDEFIDKYPKEIKGTKVKIIPCIDPEDRDTIYTCGKSGSGKSYWVGNYIEEYKKVFPNNNIIVFSLKARDKALDKHNPIRIDLDEELYENPIHIDEIANSLVIFDDIDSMDSKISKKNKMIKAAIMLLKDNILQVGRSNHITIAVTSHNVTDYKESRIVLQEASLITLFPHSGTPKQIIYCLKEYAGLADEQIKKILKLPSRWVTIRLNAPIAVIYEKGIYLP